MLPWKYYEEKLVFHIFKKKPELISLLSPVKLRGNYVRKSKVYTPFMHIVIYIDFSRFTTQGKNSHQSIYFNFYAALMGSSLVFECALIKNR